jgi:hypothetical protein
MDLKQLLARNQYVEIWLDDAEVSSYMITDEMLEIIFGSMREDYIPDYCIKDEYVRPLYLFKSPTYEKSVFYYYRGSPFEELACGSKAHWGPDYYPLDRG